MMSVKGNLKSRYKDVEAPVVTDDNGTTHAVAASAILTSSKPGAEVIAMGSGYSFINGVVSQGQGQINAVFLLNVADALTRNGELIALRSKQVRNAALKPNISAAEQSTATALAVIGVPILLVLFGLFQAYRLRLRRKRYQAVYGASTPTGQEV
jgi:hypothetical protein